MPLYRVCTKVMFTSKGCYGYTEPRNLSHSSVQKPHLPVQAGKVPRLMGCGIGPRTETFVNWGGPIPMVPCLHQGNAYIKRKLRVWRALKCISLVGAETPLTSAGRKTAPSHGGQYGAENANLRGPIAMVPCLHQGKIYFKRKLWAWRAQKYIPLASAETPLTCVGLQTTRSHGGQYRAENGNLRKLGWTFHHGTMFAPSQCLYQKEGTGMESPEMCSTSRWRNSTYLCGYRKTTPSDGGRYRA